MILNFDVYPVLNPLGLCIHSHYRLTWHSGVGGGDQKTDSEEIQRLCNRHSCPSEFRRHRSHPNRQNPHDSQR